MTTPAKHISESAIQRSILDYLQAKGVLAFRMNTGAMRTKYKGKEGFIRFGVPGMADVLAFGWSKQTLWTGTYLTEAKAMLPIWIECKAPKRKQSELQKSFQAQVEAHGHRYVIARSIDDLEGLL